MSANNCAVCPRCLIRANAAYQAETQALAAGYGTIPLAEYTQRTAACKLPDPQQYHTFLEYYEIYGAETGTVKVTYGASCGKCGLSVNFEHEHPIPGVAEELMR